jgi:ribosomal protein L11 methyltransferase
MAPFDIAPRWQILPPGAAPRPGALPIHLLPGPGFGDGRHPTSQLCLQAISALAPRDRPWRLLDFGSGSGILSIAAARLGAQVDAVEIDPAAVAHAEENLRANGVSARVRHLPTLAAARGTYDLVVANILRTVLLAFADALVPLRAPGGALVLSGLVSTDVPALLGRYEARAADEAGGGRPRGKRAEVYERDEWRALVWR